VIKGWDIGVVRIPESIAGDSISGILTQNLNLNRLVWLLVVNANSSSVSSHPPSVDCGLWEVNVNLPSGSDRVAAALAYGKKGTQGIPGNSVLHFGKSPSLLQDIVCMCDCVC
jgi:hypothetical protein